MSPLPSIPSRLPSAVDVTKAMRSVSDHREEVTPEVSDCEHAYAARAIERSQRRPANYAEPLPMALPAMEASDSWASGG